MYDLSCMDLYSLVRILARIHYAAHQSISSWTGLNILVNDMEDIREDSIGYLPINAPATILSTVYEATAVSLLTERDWCTLPLELVLGKT